MLGETVCKPMDAPPITTVWVVRFTAWPKTLYEIALVTYNLNSRNFYIERYIIVFCSRQNCYKTNSFL